MNILSKFQVSNSHVLEGRCFENILTKDEWVSELVKGNRAFADLRYGEEVSISPSTLFCCHKELTRDIYSPYAPWGTLEVSSDMKPKWVC